MDCFVLDFQGSLTDVPVVNNKLCTCDYFGIQLYNTSFV